MAEYSKQEALRGIEMGNGMQKNNSNALRAHQKKPLKVGDQVKLKKFATIWNSDKSFPDHVYHQKLFISAINGSRAILSPIKQTGTGGVIAGATDINNLEKA